MLIWGKDALAVRAPFEGQVELGPVVISAYRFFIICAVVVVSVVLGIVVHRTVYGRRLRALAQNREVASLTGINTSLIGSLTFAVRSEEHTSELQSLMRISYAVFCLKKKKK